MVVVAMTWWCLMKGVMPILGIVGKESGGGKCEGCEEGVVD
jgi:hypothetical protein